MKPNDDRSAPSKGCTGRPRGRPLGPWGAATGAGGIWGLPLGLLGVAAGVDCFWGLPFGLLGVGTCVGGGSGGDGRGG